jgi:hypothetical protein
MRIIILVFALLLGGASTAFALSWEEDTDGDGRKETRFRDDDGDGNPDAASVDRDGDGRFEEYWVDKDDDGDWDRMWVDADGDGVWERGQIDDDGDGDFELEWIDDNRNGKIDPGAGEVRRRPEGQQPPVNGPRPKVAVNARTECDCLGRLPEPSGLVATSPRSYSMVWIGVVVLLVVLALLIWVRRQRARAA